MHGGSRHNTLDGAAPGESWTDFSELLLRPASPFDVEHCHHKLKDNFKIQIKNGFHMVWCNIENKTWMTSWNYNVALPIILMPDLVKISSLICYPLLRTRSPQFGNSWYYRVKNIFVIKGEPGAMLYPSICFDKKATLGRPISPGSSMRISMETSILLTALELWKIPRWKLLSARKVRCYKTRINARRFEQRYYNMLSFESCIATP